MEYMQTAIPNSSQAQYSISINGVRVFTQAHFQNYIIVYIFLVYSARPLIHWYLLCLGITEFKRPFENTRKINKTPQETSNISLFYGNPDFHGAANGKIRNLVWEELL